MTEENLSRLKKLVAGGKSKILLPAAAICLGVMLLILPLPGDKKKEAADEMTQTAEKENSDQRSLLQTEDMLAQLLSSMEGAGRVRVMLAYDSGERSVYACDNIGDECRNVIITTGSQKQQTVLTSVECARYRGAVVLAQGADSAVVRLMMTQAVSAVTGLGADSISVLKMK